VGSRFASVRLSLAALLALAGCANFKGIGEDLGTGLGKGILTQLDTQGPKTVNKLVATAGTTVRSDVLNDATNAQLATAAQTAVNAAVTAAGKGVEAELPGIREGLVGKQTEAQLQETLTALLKTLDRQAQLTSRDVLRQAGIGLENDVMSLKNQARLNEILTSLGKTAADQGEIVRNRLLTGDDEHVKMIVATAMKEVVVASEEIRMKAHQELSFVQRNATESIIFASVVGTVVIFLIWRQNQKNRILLELVMSQLKAGPEAEGNALLGKVEEKAAALGIERQLFSLKALQDRFRPKPPERKD
jgi:hypothetical protein